MKKENYIYFKDRKDWREWLEKNHLKEKNVSVLCYKKHTGKPSMTHRESMEEAICFGWIDTTLKSLDENRYMRRFARRGEKGKWSENTLSYAKKLVEDKMMSPEGMKRYLEGLSRPTHDAGIPKNPEVPEDLKKELSKNKKAKENFENFAPSYKRNFLRWLARAKMPETRKKRIGFILQKAENNDKKW